MSVNWLLGAQQGPGIGDQFNAAFERGQLRRQQQEQMTRQREVQDAGVRAGKHVAAGDYSGATRQAAQSGNIDLMRTIQGLSAEQRQQVAAQNARLGPLYLQARRMPYEQRRAFIASVRDRLVAETGIPTAQIDGYDPTDERLDADIAAGMTMAQALEQGSINWEGVAGGEMFATDAQGRPLAPNDPRLRANAPGMAPQAPQAGVPQVPAPGQPAPAQGAPQPAIPQGSPLDPNMQTPAPSPAAASQGYAPNSIPALLYGEYRSLGYTDEGARTMVAQIGRENDFNLPTMSGSHTDANNGRTNVGMISFQGPRNDAFMRHMAERGFVQNGRISPTVEALREQARYSDQEMRARYPQSAAAVRNPNMNYDSIEPTLSNNYFGWDRAGRRLPNAPAHLAQMRAHYDRTAPLSQGGPAPNQYAQANVPNMPGQPQTAQEQAMTGRVARPAPPGFENDGMGGIRPIRGSQPEYERQRDARQSGRDARTDERASRAEISQIRQQFRADPEVRQFRQVRVATEQIRRLAQSGNAASDMGLIFSFMRALDPTSTVREGEFATAQNATGIDGRIRNLYNQAQSGTRLNAQQRREMTRTAYDLYLSRAESYNEIARSYHEDLRALGVNNPGSIAPLATGPATEARRRQRGQQQGQQQGRPIIRVISRRPAR